MSIEVSEEEIRRRIKQIEQDSRFDRENPANVQINAPLALQQATMEARLNTLKWLLGEESFGAGVEPLDEEDGEA
jgi:hypothetical protein